ncbi:mucin-2-like [Malaya genurostris]|uniref:mucin-2-like n=1 Tax=Malaya genurostris TaxID=325434 RepID=UPI0026F3ECE3|nr:mucin-2-like [Malaya genurostris]XP_058452724.1 mucin-2-like [Malaya genurostris]
MKHKSILLLLCLLVGPALAMPNMEPIYTRGNRNPLEVTEEFIATTNTLPTIGSKEEDQTTIGSSSPPAPQSKFAAESKTPTTTAAPATVQEVNSSPLFKRQEVPLKAKLATSGYVVSTSTKILTSAGIQHLPKASSNEGKGHENVGSYEKLPRNNGVAEPLSDEDYPKELGKPVEQGSIKLQTTTPKEGLSTWVLLSGSNSVTSTESKKEIVNTTKKPYTSTTRRPATTSGRKPVTTPRRRTTTNTRSTPIISEEKKEKINKFINRIKASSLEGIKPKVDNSTLITKKPKKPIATTSTTTTPATTTTTTTTSTTTELTLTESSLGSTSSDERPDDNALETSTFLILEPKDALFDLPEDRSPTKVAKKKPIRKNGTATKKKNSKKKPEEKDALGKPGDKGKPTKSKPMTTQIMNFLSREVMPTVGVGLVGLVITAGLASYFLGSPLTAALRRSDETNRKDDVYFSNYEDYATTDGQNEEEVFGKLIAGMPERSYYRNNIRRRISQPARTGHQYGNYHVQSYSANKYPHINYRNRPAYAGTPEMYAMYNRNAQAKSHNEFYYNTPPSYQTKMSSPAFTPTESPVYTTTSTTQTPLTSADPVSASVEGMDDPEESEPEMLPNPAAYTAEHRPEHHAQYVVGSVYHQDNSMLDIITSAPVPEHGPRRRKRDLSVEQTENDHDNEISGSEEQKPISSINSAMATSSEGADLNGSNAVTEEDKIAIVEPLPADERPITWSELIRNTVEMKMVMGIKLLQQVTSQFQRYLNGVQNRVGGVFNQTTVRQ